MGWEGWGGKSSLQRRLSLSPDGGRREMDGDEEDGVDPVNPLSSYPSREGD